MYLLSADGKRNERIWSSYGIYELELDSGDVRESSKVSEFTQQALSTKDGTTLVVSSWDSEYNQKHFICRNNLDW